MPWRESDRLRWPRGAPEDQTGHGQGGRFRDRNQATAWIASLASRAGAWALWRDRDAIAQLATEPHMDAGPLSGGGVATTRRLDYGAGRYLVHKRFGRGTNMSTFHSSAKRRASAEYLASRVAEAVDAPAPVVVKDRMDDRAVYMGYVPGDLGEVHEPDDMAGPRFFLARTESGLRIGLLDVLIRNEDRHSSNWIMSHDPEPSAGAPSLVRRPVAIDHSETFEEGQGVQMAAAAPRGRQFVLPWEDASYIGFSGAWLQRGAHVWTPGQGQGYDPDVGFYRTNPLHRDDVPVLRARLEALRPEFQQEGMLGAYMLMMRRFDGVAAHAGGAARMYLQ